MNFRGKLYAPEYAKELIEIAEGDLKSAKGLFKIREGRLENICYLAQQSVEKCLKAILCHNSREIVFTHDIDVLISLLPKSASPPHKDDLGELTEYSMVRRYEKGYAILTDKEIELALQVAKDVVEWAKALVNKSTM